MRNTRRLEITISTHTAWNNHHHISWNEPEWNMGRDEMAESGRWGGNESEGVGSNARRVKKDPRRSTEVKIKK